MHKAIGTGLMAILLAGCGGGDDDGSAAMARPAVKRQPGSWTTQVRIVRLVGEDASPQMQAQMQGMFDAMGKMAICVTPEAAAAEDPARTLTQSAGRGECAFSRKVASGETLDVAATCKGQDGADVRMTAKGSIAAAAQSLNVTVEKLGPGGKVAGTMEMAIASRRTGPCKPGDLTPPTAPPAGQASPTAG
jgi:hypothetical protein